jgi:hypothetical protein
MIEPAIPVVAFPIALFVPQVQPPIPISLRATGALANQLPTKKFQRPFTRYFRPPDLSQERLFISHNIVIEFNRLRLLPRQKTLLRSLIHRSHRSRYGR